MKKMYIATGMVALMVSAAMLAGCGAGSSVRSTASTVSTVQATESVKAVESTKTAAPEAESAKAVESAAAPEASGKAAPGQITVEDAKKAAFGDAGLTEGDVVIKQAVLDIDDGIQKYEVDFYANDTEYEYDIDAETGAILKAERDPMDTEDRAEMEALQGRAADPARAAEGVTEDMALEIALRDAGVAMSDISFSKVTLEHDEDMNRMEYDVEFHVGTTEYSYEIDPDTGAIFESEVDIDD